MIDFSNDRFRERVTSNYQKLVLENSDRGFNKFLDACKEALKVYASLKTKYIRGNNSPFMNGRLSKKIMKKSRLRNKFLRSKSKDYQKNYVKQRNNCASLLRRPKKEYHGNLDSNKVADDRKFWRTVNPFLSN